MLSKNRFLRGCVAAEWFRALNLKSEVPRFKSSTLPLSWICFSVAPSSTPLLCLVNSQLVCPQPARFFFLATWWVGYFFTAVQEFFSITFVLHAIFFFRQALAGIFFQNHPPPPSRVKWSAPFFLFSLFV